VAAGLERISDREDKDEISAVEMVKLDQVHDMIISGRIRDGKTVIGVSLFRAKMEKGEIPDNFFV
jgi:hypothetical protein